MTPRRHAASSSTWTTSPSTLVSLFLLSLVLSLFRFLPLPKWMEGGTDFFRWEIALKETIASERRKKKPGPEPCPTAPLCLVDFYVSTDGGRKRRQDRVPVRREKKHTPYWSTFYIIATSSRKSRDHQIPGHFLPSPLAVSENRFRWNTWWDERWYLPLFFHGFTKRLLYTKAVIDPAWWRSMFPILLLLLLLKRRGRQVVHFR